MTTIGLREGNEAIVLVACDTNPLCEVIVKCFERNGVEVSVFSDVTSELLLAQEILRAALSAIDIKIDRSNLKELLRQRIEELRRWEAEGEDTADSPTDANDIPF